MPRRTNEWYCRASESSRTTQSRTVDNFDPNFAFRNFLRCRFAPMPLVCRSLCLLFFGGLLAGLASATDPSSARSTSLGPSGSFSVADFDGDSKPDLASVLYGTSDSGRTDYLIQLQLSAAGWQSFQIPAPIGGLQIVARDVNGDHALDLVITTTWLRQPVAILLNDGHGNFSRVDSDAFPGAFRESDIGWNSSTQHEIEAVGVPPQSRDEIWSGTEHFLHLRAHTGLAPGTNSQFGFGSFLISHRGRAPPSEVSHA